jgi:toxin CcdB
VKQFDVCENLAELARAPFLIVLQSDQLSHLPVRLVAPLVFTSSIEPIKLLNPGFTVEGKQVTLATIEMVALPRRLIGKTVASLESERFRIISAIDLLFTGF